MSGRISDYPVTDSLLQAGIDWASVDSSTRHIASALTELQQSRALISQHNELVAKLMTLLQSMRRDEKSSESLDFRDDLQNGKSVATEYWADQLDSLLSAHGEAQADADVSSPGLAVNCPMGTHIGGTDSGAVVTHGEKKP